ncbi:MAG: rhodanese-like domain-containing protein [Bdellovibrio sp.]|nr:rhodanese-like domain-containing protein [Bdellovibrio sp.]
MDYNEIGYFQFNNLIHGRVPMVLVNLGVDLKTWYKSVEAMHIDNVTVTGSTEEILQKIQSRKLPPHYPIMVIDENGTTYKSVIEAIEAAGFMNVYTVKGGFVGLQNERAQQ